MMNFVPCPCGGMVSPCYACLETGKIGPISYEEYKAYCDHLAKENQIKNY